MLKLRSLIVASTGAAVALGSALPAEAESGALPSAVVLSMENSAPLPAELSPAAVAARSRPSVMELSQPEAAPAQPPQLQTPQLQVHRTFRTTNQQTGVIARNTEKQTKPQMDAIALPTIVALAPKKSAATASPTAALSITVAQAQFPEAESDSFYPPVTSEVEPPTEKATESVLTETPDALPLVNPASLPAADVYPPVTTETEMPLPDLVTPVNENEPEPQPPTGAIAQELVIEAATPAAPEAPEPTATETPEPPTVDEFVAQTEPGNAEALQGRTQEVPPPDFLNPSGNPLLFPTEADEVTIDISQPITLQEAIALARRNNQDLQAARLGLEQSYARLKEARAGLFPTVDGTVSLTRSNSASAEISSDRAGALSRALGNDDATTDTFDAEVQVSYNLLNGGQVAAQIREAKHQIRFLQLEVEQITEEIDLEATEAYYDLQEANQQVEIEQQAVEQANQTLRDAELLLEAGLGTRFDVIRGQVDLANSEQALTQAIATQSIAQRQLSESLGLGQQVEVTIADEIEPVEPWELSLEETIVLAYRNRAELEQQLVQREIEEENRQIALSALRPQVSVFASYNVLDILDDDFDGSTGYTIGAQLQWRLFDGGAARARRRQAEIDLELAEVAFEQERNQIRLQVEQAYFGFQANEQNIKTAAAAVQLAEESLRLARLRFQAGVGTQTDVIDAQTELTRARGNLLTAIVNYNNSIASLRRAVSNTPDRRLFDLP